jgi:hypothetical protein
MRIQRTILKYCSPDIWLTMDDIFAILNTVGRFRRDSTYLSVNTMIAKGMMDRKEPSELCKVAQGSKTRPINYVYKVRLCKEN